MKDTFGLGENKDWLKESVLDCDGFKFERKWYYL